jgi:hypothetical protein
MKRMFFMLAAATTLLFSCSKDHEDKKSPEITVTGKKLVQTNVNYPTTFAYNANGTLKDATYEAWGYTYKRSYTYEGSAIKYITMNMSTNKLAETGTYTLANGKVTTFNRWECNAGGEPTWNYNETFEYNPQGLVSRHTYTDGAYRKLYYDANGDLTKKEYYNSQSIVEGESVYTYFDKEDKFPWFGVFESWFLNFAVHPFSKHLVKSKTNTSFIDPADNNTTTYSYELDAAGYVLKGSSHFVIGQQVSDFEWQNVFE